MRYFIDTEFDENGPAFPLALVSLAMVREDGAVFHCCVEGAPAVVRNPWVRENVLPHLHGPWLTLHDIPHRIGQFLAGDDSPEFWGYYCDYDWVVLCQLFGDMSRKPSTWPYYCRDLRQSLDERGFVHVKQSDDAAHNALADAQWIAQTYKAWITPSIWQLDFSQKWYPRNDPPCEPEPGDEEIAEQESR